MWCRQQMALSASRSVNNGSVRTDADPQRYGLACRVAEAQIDLVRVRHVRRDLLDSVVGHPKDAARLRSASDRAGILSKRTEPKIEDPDYAQAPNGTPARDQ
jgi:hypothetical protein